MTLTRKLMLGMAVLIGAFAVMTLIVGSIEAATTSTIGSSNGGDGVRRGAAGRSRMSRCL